LASEFGKRNEKIKTSGPVRRNKREIGRDPPYSCQPSPANKLRQRP